MTRQFSSDVVFTPAVKAQQEERGSRRSYARLEEHGGFATEVDERLRKFLAERDSFYLATASAEGQPYVQHRGGPKGFLRVLDDHTLAFADYGGNKQYISVGMLSENPRASIFAMDYPKRRRIKIWGRARVVEDDAELLAKLAGPETEDVAERAIVFHVEAWDVNCPRYIEPRFTEAELQPRLEEMAAREEALRTRIRELEAQLGEREAIPA